MNKFAYRTTGLAIKTIEAATKANIKIHGEENIPKGSIIYVINHFTRIETFLIPYHISKITNKEIWSLASSMFFKGSLGRYLNKVGAISTKDPDRDKLIVKTLLTNEASWIIFPEGNMVKNKKLIEKGEFMVSYLQGKHPPHTGAAFLALRTEFYRQRIKKLLYSFPDEVDRLLNILNIDSSADVLNQTTYIVPVNLSYYPIRARENKLSRLASKMVEDLPENILEEIMTEGTMLFSGVDIDMRFGKPIKVSDYLNVGSIQKEIGSLRQINFNDKLSCVGKLIKTAWKIMEKYMKSIYDMTTINHDHIFSAILRFMNFKCIEETDFRNRAYLAIEILKRRNDIFFHHNLEKNQINLLTDDHSDKFCEFVELAIEKSLISKEGSCFKKNTKKFSSNTNFSKVRIDNPIEVYANSLEPLFEVQLFLKQISNYSEKNIKKRLIRFLLQKTKNDFDNDYKKFYKEGESKDKSTGAPFLLKSSRTTTGVLLIHGYMAAPKEVRKLAEYLYHKGYSVYAPRLKGHGTSPEDLNQRRYQDWIDSADEGYALLRTFCTDIIVGGFSTGAGLALEIATRKQAIKGVFCVCPPLILQDISSRFVPAVEAWNQLMNKMHFNDAKNEFIVNHPENPDINYTRNPIRGVNELEQFMRFIRSKLKDITIPALVIQSQNDPVVNPKGTRIVFDEIASTDKEYVIFNFNRHGILLHDGSERVHRVIRDFIDHLK